MAVELGYGRRRPVDHPTPFEPAECFHLKLKRSNPARRSISGVICGIRVEDMEQSTMKEIRYLDKLVDELARGKAMTKILRSG